MACRFELRGSVADYAQSAAAHLAAGGIFACVFPLNDGHERRMTDAARDAGLTIVRRRPVVFREGLAPLVGLFVLMRDDDLPAPFRTSCWSEPPLVIRTAEGRVHAEYAAIKLAFGFPP